MEEREEKILIFGAEGGSETLVRMLWDSGFAVCRINRRRQLIKYMADSRTVCLVYDFTTIAADESDSIGFLMKLREDSDKPILALAEAGNEMLRILALNAGADAVLSKKTSVMETMAQIRALARCYRRFCPVCQEDRLIRQEDLLLDDGRKSVYLGEEKIDLTPTEYKILYLLMENPGKVFSNNQIYQSIWKMEPIGADNTVAVHIRHLREKIEPDPKNPHYIQVVWGQGYKVG